MTAYTCEVCGMSIGIMTCGKCGKELVHNTITTDDGQTVHVLWAGYVLYGLMPIFPGLDAGFGGAGMTMSATLDGHTKFTVDVFHQIHLRSVRKYQCLLRNRG
jgi:hypothetical protein